MSDDAFERYVLFSTEPPKKLSCHIFSFTYVGNDGLSHIASRSILSMNSSNARSQSNIYLDDPDYYHQQQNVHHLPPQYSASTINVSSMGADPSAAASTMKNATSMQQLKGPQRRITNEVVDLNDQQQRMNMDHDYPQQQQSVTSIPEIYEQQLMNERLMCIQQMMASGQNFASMFNDDPHFAQQIMAYIAAAQQQEPEVIEIMDE